GCCSEPRCRYRCR
nr:Chain A, Alpha-conotoxin RgIA [synthetic construct]